MGCGFGAAAAAFHSPTLGAGEEALPRALAPTMKLQGAAKMNVFVAEDKSTHTAFPGPPAQTQADRGPPPIAQGQPHSCWPAAWTCSQQRTAFQVREDGQNIPAQISPDFNCLHAFSIPQTQPWCWAAPSEPGPVTKANQCNPHRWAVSGTEGTAGGQGRSLPGASAAAAPGWRSLKGCSWESKGL